MSSTFSESLNEEDRTRLALSVMGIFDHWNLQPDEQLQLLGMGESGKARHLSRYKHGTPFPDENDILERAKRILGIQQALDLIYAQNPNMPAFWLTHRNKKLKGIPLRIMLDGGLHGMHRVWHSLDCTADWD